MSKSIMLNELPRPTFRWLKNNYTDGELWQSGQNKAAVTIEGNSSIISEFSGHTVINKNYKGANEEALQSVVNNPSHTYEISVPASADEAVTITIDLAGREVTERIWVRLQVANDAKLNVLYVLTGDAKATNSVQLFTEVVAQDNATVVVKKVQLLGERSQQIEHRYTKMAKSSQVEFINLEIGGQDNYLNYEETLVGEESHLIHDLAYLGDQEQRFDISMLMTHEGKKTYSDIHTIGALSGTSKKSFRGTLDFLRGSSQSEGAEEDTCLLLNPKVKSVSLPLLLCKEDNVSGNHAASAGQLDHNKLFYLMSRGFSETEAKHIIVESMLRPIIDRINNESLEEKALQAVREKI